MKLTARAAVAGALAGIAGSLAMHVFRQFWDSATKNSPEYGMFGFDREADINAARLVNAVLFSRPTPEDEAEKLGLFLHYLYGGAVGLFYGTFATRSYRLRNRHGTSFGAALWLLGDEIPVSLSGVSDPFKKNYSSHAAALTAHLLFGIVVEQVFARANLVMEHSKERTQEITPLA